MAFTITFEKLNPDDVASALGGAVVRLLGDDGGLVDEVTANGSGVASFTGNYVGEHNLRVKLVSAPGFTGILPDLTLSVVDNDCNTPLVRTCPLYRRVRFRAQVINVNAPHDRREQLADVHLRLSFTEDGSTRVVTGVTQDHSPLTAFPSREEINLIGPDAVAAGHRVRNLSLPASAGVLIYHQFDFLAADPLPTAATLRATLTDTRSRLEWTAQTTVDLSHVGLQNAIADAAGVGGNPAVVVSLPSSHPRQLPGVQPQPPGPDDPSRSRLIFVLPGSGGEVQTPAAPR